MSVAFVDSVTKIVETYFAVVTNEEFTYKGTRYKPRPIQISPKIFRDTTCPPNCGGCCLKFSLDYIPSDPRPDDKRIKKRFIEFSGRKVKIYSDTQQDREGEHFCRHVDMDDGRCGIHGDHPFSCDFELLRFIMRNDRPIVMVRLFGRGWALTRVDGEKGALCEVFVPEDMEAHKKNIVRKFNRLKAWADHFELDTCIPDIVRWIEAGPHDNPLYLNEEHKSEHQQRKPDRRLPILEGFG
tara:strand:+ start:2427 stop:3146 length:720 start_codon:yes stop_codon:yes gene_type:complete